MSVYAAVKKNGKICLGCDSISSFGPVVTNKFHRENPKFFIINDVYFACYGPASIEFHMKAFFKDIAAQKFSTRESVFLNFEKFYNYLLDECHLNPILDEESEFGKWDMTFLVVAGNKIYSIFQMREVFEHDDYWAMGSGEDICIGALAALYDIDGISVQEILEKSLDVACKLDGFSSGPVHIIEVNQHS